MASELHLQAGGTLNPREHLYIVRKEDETFLSLLLKGQYVNVLTSRQMGKSSLMMRTVHRLNNKGVRWVTIDLASELGSPSDLTTYYLGFLGKIVRSLRMELDLRTWWFQNDTETINQRLLRFFREVVGATIAQPIVFFLDEIDSTLKLTYTDDLFTAIRGMYNERSLVEAYRRITFCLLGVATPNELIRDRRTTAYNVGVTLELRDFDKSVDDLSPLARLLSSNFELGRYLLDRALYWSGGQPYLTQKFCVDIVENHITDLKGVDQLVTQTFANLDRASTEIHFQQILRFMEERLSNEGATLDLYAKVIKGHRVPDQTTLAHAELKLSGLVKRDREGNLVSRNPIYQRLFDSAWIESTRPRRALDKARRFATAASIALLISVGGGTAYYILTVLPEQQRLDALDSAAQLNIGITRDSEGIRASLPPNITQKLLAEAIPVLKSIGVTEITGITGTGSSRSRSRNDFPAIDLRPFAELTDLRVLSLGNDMNITSLEPLKGLTNLTYLSLPAAQGIRSLEPLKGLTKLTSLTLDASDVTSLEPLKGLTKLTSLFLDAIGATSLESLKGLTNLTTLDILSGGGVTSLEPLEGLTNLTNLRIYIFNITGRSSEPLNLEPLKGLTKLTSLALDFPGITSLESLKGLTNLTMLDISSAHRITSLEPLKGLTNLTTLGISSASGITSLEPLRGLTNLTRLALYGPRITSLEPLKGLTNLTNLKLYKAEAITSLEPLRGLTNLTVLDLDGSTNIRSLEPLKDLPKLKRLDVKDLSRVTSLRLFKGKDIEITGASRELLATMR